MAKTPEFDPRKPRKNYFINGDMAIAQRNTSFAAAANGTYSVDRFQYIKAGAMVHTVSQDTDVPTLAQSGHLFQNSVRLNLTTPDTAIAAGDYCGIGQIIEGYNWKNLAQKPFTISFWVKATLPGTYCLGLQNSAADRGYAAEYTIDLANNWEYKTVTIPASVVAGTWNYTNGVGLKVWWMLAVGSTFQSATGSWQTGTVLGTVNQVNGVNTGATDFRITGTVINEGPDAIAFKLYGEDIVDEVAACQRYFEKSYALAIPIGSNDGNGRIFEISSGSAEIDGDYRFSVRKRSTPTVSFHDTISITSGPTIANNGETGFSINGTTAATNQNYQFHWSADAELS